MGNQRNNESAVLDNSRRKFLIGAGLVVAGAALPFSAASLLGCTRPSAVTEPTAESTPVPTPTPDMAAVPWKYAKLDSTAAAERGYTAYSQGGCMFGSFEGIVGELREEVGAPYTAFPTSMMKYGKAGVSG